MVCLAGRPFMRPRGSSEGARGLVSYSKGARVRAVTSRGLRRSGEHHDAGPQLLARRGAGEALRLGVGLLIVRPQHHLHQPLERPGIVVFRCGDGSLHQVVARHVLRARSVHHRHALAVWHGVLAQPFQVLRHPQAACILQQRSRVLAFIVAVALEGDRLEAMGTKRRADGLQRLGGRHGRVHIGEQPPRVGVIGAGARHQREEPNRQRVVALLIEFGEAKLAPQLALPRIVERGGEALRGPGDVGLQVRAEQRLERHGQTRTVLRHDVSLRPEGVAPRRVARVGREVGVERLQEREGTVVDREAVHGAVVGVQHAVHEADALPPGGERACTRNHLVQERAVALRALG
mmetsp:Transcript_23047/g.71253  ORF Transcript_23047/g.71253 Transcript_23047/m.71253 type:complete len:348 (+) Transcript_23047:104-1147(+)